MEYLLATRLKDVEDYLGRTNDLGYFGMDTEATSLNTRTAKLTGISLSINVGTAIYIPLGHRIGVNLPIVPVWRMMEEFMKKYTPVFYNSKYDLNILQVATKSIIERHIDALELVYLADPDRKRKGLKLIAKEDLGINMERFEDLFSAAEVKAKNFDISTKTPIRCTNYACADADATLQVRKHYDWVVQAYPQAVKVDTLLVDIVRRMEHNGGLELNHEYIDEQMKALENRAESLKHNIFRTVGYNFEINSPKQLGEALFDKLGLPSPGRTKTGNHITREESLDKLRTRYPVVEYIISYRKCLKAKSSYFLKLKTLGKMGLRPRFNFNIYAAPTFRFAAPGGDPNKDGATGVNIQAVSNGESRTLMGVRLEESEGGQDYLADVEDDDMLVDISHEISSEASKDADPYDLDRLATLPYVVRSEDDSLNCFKDNCDNCPAFCALRGIDTTRRPQPGLRMIPSVRQSFRSPEGWKLVSFDYDRQELVIGANMSGEPRWLKALANGEDLHEVTASTAFGVPLPHFQKLPIDEYKRKRGVGKIINFAIFYGATAYTLATKANISEQAANQLYDTFVRNHPTLFNWMSKVHIFAKKQGYTTTYFGRKRTLSQFYNGDRKMEAFGNRSAVNTAIQGTAAEVTRIAMVKVDRYLRDNGYTWKEVKPVLQLHDELDYLIRDDVLQEVLTLIHQSMEFKVKSWQVQLTAGAKVGRVWGMQHDWEYYPDTQSWEPQRKAA